MMNPEEFMSWIAWEGGLDGAVSHGIELEDVPEQIQREWLEVAAAIEGFNRKVVRLGWEWA